MASDSGNSDSEIDQTAPGRCTSREFVWLESKTKSIPRGRAWDKLNRDGRVKELAFGRYKTQVTGHRSQVTGHCLTYKESILNIHKS